MGSPATVGVDDNFTTSETSISLWSSNDELASWIDVQVGEVTVQ